jgi:hypothetical protein
LSFLLDTNVVSEWVKPQPSPNVMRWLAEADEDVAYLSVITFAEIHKGVEEMTPDRRREALATWVQHDLPDRFEGRILGVNMAIARAWGDIMARTGKVGISIGILDAFFAATAKVHNLILVTRNTRHFEKLGLELFNPWLPNR